MVNWRIRQKVEKLTKKIGALKRIRLLISAPTLHLTYQALVKPPFDYCDILWGNCGKTLRDKLQKLQNRAARVLTFSNNDADATELLKFLGRKNLARRQEILKATMTFRCLHGLAPEYLYSKFTCVTLIVTSGTLKISSMFHYRVLITTEKALAPMAPHYGTVYHAI